MSSLKVWIDLDTGARIGHGKIDLLEQIAALGSISAAGRALGMSYRRAWELVEETSGIFGEAITRRQVGGKGGGGATLTPLGRTLVSRYRAIERAAADAARAHMVVLEDAARKNR